MVVTEAHPVETATTKKIIGSFNMEVTELTHPVEEEGGEWHDTTNPESNEMTSKH